MYLAVSDGKTVDIWDMEPINETGLPSVKDVISEATSPIFSYDPRSDDLDCVRQMGWNPRTCKLFCLNHSGKQVHIQRIAPGHKERSVGEIHELIKVGVNGQKDHLGDPLTCFAFPLRVGHYFAAGRASGDVVVHAYNKQFVPRSHFNLDAISAIEDKTDRKPIVPTCITWALQDKLLVVGTEGGDLYATLATAGREVGFQAPIRLTQPGLITKPSMCATLKTSQSDSSLVAAGYTSGTVVIWRLDWPLSENTAHNLSVCLLPVPSPLLPLFNQSVSIAFPALTTQLLITAGAPDLCARVWHWDKSSDSLCSSRTSSHQTTPFHTLEPSNEKAGFLVVDLALDSFTLAAGRMDGEVWLYDLRALPAPRRRLTNFKTPVIHLAFALSLQSHDEVRFKDSVVIDRSLRPFGLSSASDENAITSILPTATPVGERFALSDVTSRSNSPMKSSRDCQWNDVFHDLSVPELSLHSSEASHSGCGSVLALLSPSILTQVTVSSVGAAGHEPDPAEPNFGHSNQTPSVSTAFAPVRLARTAKTSNSPIPELLVNGSLDRRVADLESSLCSQLNANQSELLFYFSRLEHAVQQMRSHFDEALTRLHRENEELKRQMRRLACLY
ncbi:hypothetical protein FBUS_03043 [Fasciolopsis buskii]|uniref:Uncharacterized protein n=1 Tax=Fasciolopsis buskii TaxID=27845 RepID=A0A8E0RWC9_9TREM|nr:hypothetical protein FBUS_03043 [Fasciolopsis buski]